MIHVKWRLQMLWYRILRVFSKKKARAYLYALPPMKEFFAVKDEEIERHRAEVNERVMLRGPSSCPKCSARIELEGDTYHCVGLKNRAEVEQYLTWCAPGGRVPEDLTSRKPCGWSGKKQHYGLSWE